MWTNYNNVFNQVQIVFWICYILKFLGLSSGVSPRYFYCGKTTVISVQAVTAKKHTSQYRAKRYRWIHNLPQKAEFPLFMVITVG